MATLELDFNEANEVVNEAIKGHGIFQTEAEWLEAFYQNTERQLLDIYEAARIGAWRIYDRERVATYWDEQTKWFEDILANLQTTQGTILGAFKGSFEIPALLSAIETVNDVIGACRAAYELHA
jgi:hypothetical protein